MECQQTLAATDPERACPGRQYLSRRCAKAEGPTSDVSACDTCTTCGDDFFASDCKDLTPGTCKVIIIESYNTYKLT